MTVFTWHNGQLDLGWGALYLSIVLIIAILAYAGKVD
jgi:hypothetical protein